MGFSRSSSLGWPLLLLSLLQLLQKIKQVNFTLYKSRISFDANGDIHKGYDIIMWNWSGPSWAFDVIGTFSVNPDRLSIDQGKILWHTSNRQVPSCTRPPVLLTAEPAPAQHRQLRGVHLRQDKNEGRWWCCGGVTRVPSISLHPSKNQAGHTNRKGSYFYL